METLTGRDLRTGEALPMWQRGVTGAAMLVPFVGGSAVRSALNGLGEAVEGAVKHTDEAADVVSGALKNSDEVVAGAGKELKISDSQFGKKVGKHAEDFGLDPSNPASRDFVKNRTNEIFSSKTKIRQGEWMGLGEKLPGGSHASGQARFYIQGNDVVVTDLNGNFVTIMKDGVNNLRVQGATKIWP